MAAAQLMAGISIGLWTAKAGVHEVAPRQTDVKKEINSAYKFAAPMQVTSESTPIWSTRPMPTVKETTRIDPDLVTLEPLQVSGGYRDDGLHAKLLRQDQDARAKAVLGKLGIRVYEKKFRKVSVGATTLFWIPISVGVSW